jgi:hypothetical protein
VVVHFDWGHIDYRIQVDKFTDQTLYIDAPLFSHRPRKPKVEIHKVHKVHTQKNRVKCVNFVNFATETPSSESV